MSLDDIHDVMLSHAGAWRSGPAVPDGEDAPPLPVDASSLEATDASGGASTNPDWDPIPLARAILADREASPVALLAAWRSLYHGDHERLTQLAIQAAAPTRPGTQT